MSIQIHKHIKTTISNIYQYIQPKKPKEEIIRYTELTQNKDQFKSPISYPPIQFQSEDKVSELITNTTSLIPLYVEHSFQFLEFNSKQRKTSYSLPFNQMNTETLIEWAEKNKLEMLISMIYQKKITGKTIGQLTKEDLMEKKIRIVECDQILKKIKEYKHLSLFPKKLLEGKIGNDEIIRKMYQFIQKQNNNQMIPFNSMTEEESITISFTIIKNYLISFDELLSKETIEKIFDIYLNLLEQNDDDILVELFEKEIKQELSPLQFAVIMRTLHFLYKMSNCRNMIFMHFRDLFEEKILKFLTPYSSDTNLTFLLLFYSLKMTKEQKEKKLMKNPLYSEYDKLLYGEYIIARFENVMLSHKLFLYTSPIGDVNENDWGIGCLYLTNWRLWWKPYDVSWFIQHPVTIKQSYIPLRSISEIKQLDTKCDITKERQYCMRILDLLLRSYLFLFPSQNTYYLLMEKMTNINIFEDNYPIHGYECFSYSIPLSRFSVKKLKRNGYEEINEEFGIYLNQENEFIIPIEILKEGLFNQEANSRNLTSSVDIVQSNGSPRPLNQNTTFHRTSRSLTATPTHFHSQLPQQSTDRADKSPRSLLSPRTPRTPNSSGPAPGLYSFDKNEKSEKLEKSEKSFRFKRQQTDSALTPIRLNSGNKTSTSQSHFPTVSPLNLGSITNTPNSSGILKASNILNISILSDSNQQNKNLLRNCTFIYKHPFGGKVVRLISNILDIKPKLSKQKIPKECNVDMGEQHDGFLYTKNELHIEYSSVLFDIKPNPGTYLLKTAEEMNGIWNKIEQTSKLINRNSEYNNIINTFKEYINYMEIVLKNTIEMMKRVIDHENLLLRPREENEHELNLYSALIQFIGDRYYWSYEGFIELIFQEFIQSNYFFMYSNKPSPVFPHSFLVFLRIVTSIIVVTPNAFEFGQQLINHLQIISKSGFARFSESTSQKSIIRLLCKKDQFINKNYDKDSQIDIVHLYDDNCYSNEHTVLVMMKLLSISYNNIFPSNLSLQKIEKDNKKLFNDEVSIDSQIDKLKEISLEGTNLVVIPQQISTITQLEKLHIHNCSVHYIPVQFFIHLNQLTYLNISEEMNSSDQLTKLPQFSYLTNLKYLNISYQSKSSNESIYIQLPYSLKTFIAKSSITTLPRMDHLNQLEYLDISENRNLSLNEITSIMNLKTFIGSHIHSSFIPPSIMNIKLKELQLSHCKLKRIPLQFYQCSSLQHIDFSNNSITSISLQLSQLTNLTEFSLTNNPLQCSFSLKPLPTVHLQRYPPTLHLFANKQCFSSITRSLKLMKKSLPFDIVTSLNRYSSKPQLLFNLVDFDKPIIPTNFNHDDIYLFHDEWASISFQYVNYYLPFNKKIYCIGEKKSMWNFRKNQQMKQNTDDNRFIYLDTMDPVQKLCHCLKQEQTITDELRYLATELNNILIEDFVLSKDHLVEIIRFFHSIPPKKENKYLQVLSTIGIVYDLKGINDDLVINFRNENDKTMSEKYILKHSFEKKKAMVEKELQCFKPLKHCLMPLTDKMSEKELVYICKLLEYHHVLFLIYPTWLEAMNIITFSQRHSAHFTTSALNSSTEHHKSVTTTSSSRSSHFSVDLIYPVVIYPLKTKFKEEMWPKHSKNEMELMRQYKFVRPSYIIYLQLVGYLLMIGMELYDNIYSDATILKDERFSFLYLVKISYDNGKLFVSIRYHANSIKQVRSSINVIRTVKEGIKRICKNNQNEYEELIGCTECILTDVKNIVFVSKRIVQTTIKDGKSELKFHKSHQVKVGTCSPDYLTKKIERSVKIIHNEEIELQELKGFGGSAAVHKILLKSDNDRLVAFKKFKFTDSDRELVEKGLGSSAFIYSSCLEEMQRELVILKLSLDKSIKHSKYILHLEGVCLNPLGIVMEYMDKGTLQDYILNKQNELPLQLIVRFAKHINKALHVLHVRKFIHRDMKSPNVLLKYNSKGKLIACLSDFGLSGMYNDQEDVLVENPLWLAPEVLINNRFVYQSDIYAFGIVLWEMMSRETPFSECKFMTEIAHKIKSGERPKFKPTHCSHQTLKYIVERCWNEDIKQRLCFETIDELLKSVY